MALRSLLPALLGSFLLLLTGPAAAQSSEGFDLATALATPIASGLTGAREADRFAWVETAGGVRNVWVASPGTPARPVTDNREDDGQLLYHVRLSADGRRIAYVRGGDDEFADGSLPNAGSAVQTPPQQLWLIDGDGAAPKLIGDGHSPAFSPDGSRIAFTRRGEIWLWDAASGAKKIATVDGSVTDLSWSRDASRLLFADNRGDHSFVALLDLAAARLRYLDPGLDYSVEPVFSPDGAQVAFIRYADPPPETGPREGSFWSIRVADTATGKARMVWRAPGGRGGTWYGTRQRNLYWAADGSLVFPWEKTGWIQLYALDAARGGTPRALTHGDFEVETFIPTPDGRAIVYAANAETLDGRQLWRVPVAGGKPERLTRGKGMQAFPTFAGSTLAAIETDVTHPAHAVVVADGKPLGKAPELAGFVAPEVVTYTAEDGVTVHAQRFRGKGKGPRPALVFVHGGPRRQMLPGFHPMGYYSNAYILNQQLAAHGYDVLSINYRSGTGYGQDFRDAPETARDGASEYRDVIAAGRWLEKQPDIDPRRIGIWGGSWGGYLTALALARDSDLFAAGADFHGVHAMVRPVSKTLSPDQEAAAHQLQWQSSPMGAIDRWRSPVLLIHGDDDRSVDFYQSLLLARALTARGVPFEQLVFPNDRHEFFRFAHWLQSYRATIDFLDRHLKHREIRP